ncbi:MAG: FxLYD domain-containing protein [Ahrensia sp.]|nr:FxLYD domain-containing protein [Ahrensia sp.]
MTIICPSCEARFQDPPPEILATKALRCGLCDHVWNASDDTEAAVGADPATIELPKVEAPSIVPDIDDVIGDVEEPIHTSLPVVIAAPTIDIEKEPPTIVPLYVDREDTAPAPNRLGRSALTLLGLSTVAAICAAIVLQPVIVSAFPQTQKYYDTAGIDLRPQPLKISNIETQHRQSDGLRQLIVRGEIANNADHTVEVPHLQLTMRGEGQARLYEWTAAAAKNELKAGETSRFTAITKGFPEDAVHVEVTFVQ